VRRLVALLVVALLGATLFGLSSTATGLRVNDWHLSPTAFRTELSAISTNLTLQCYVTALEPVSYAKGAGANTMVATGSASWANLRIEGEAIDQFVKTTYHFAPTAAELSVAESSLETELTQSAASRSYNCPGTAAEALAAMPAEMRTDQIKAQAASLFLLTKLDGTIPLTGVALQTYYDAHVSDYDTLCISIALVSPTQLSAFQAAQKGGATVAELAKQFSVDASGKTGGAYGCYAPTNSSYASIRADVANRALNTFPATPQYISYNGGTYALFVAATKRTTTPFAKASSAVVTDVQSLNAVTANAAKEHILYRAAIAVDPAFGRWGLNTTGPTVFTLATPAKAAVGDAGIVKTLTAASKSTYK